MIEKGETARELLATSGTKSALIGAIDRDPLHEQIRPAISVGWRLRGHVTVRASCGGLMQGTCGLERMVSRYTMTIRIPDDLARGLEGIAAAQQKNVEQVALDSLRGLFDRASSPEAVLRAARKLPHPSAAAVDDLEAAIAAGRLPVSDQGAFDRRPPG